MFLRRDLSLQLLLLYILFVGPVILAGLIFDRLASQRLEADVKAADLALARAIAQESNTVLENALQAVKQLSTYAAVQQSDVQRMGELFSVLMAVRPDVNLIYRLDENGIMAYHYPTGPGSTVGWDFSERDYYQSARLNHAPLLSQGRISPTTQQPVATAVMPLWDAAGRFTGLVATNIKLESLSRTLTSIASEYRPEEDFQVMIIDASGQVIADHQPARILSQMRTQLPEITQAVLSGISGNVISTNKNEQERLYSFVPIPSTGWGVIVSRPTAAAFATQNATHRGVLFTMVVFLIVGLFFWLALSRRVIRPLESLADFSQNIGHQTGAQAGPAAETLLRQRQELQQLARRPDQIGHLVQSLTRMEQAIDARLKELSTLLETSAAVVSSLDSQIVLNRILEQVERLMDVPMCAIVALDEQHQVFRAQASRGLSQHYTEQLSIDPSEPNSPSLRAIRSGEPVQISDTEQDESFAISRPRARSEGYRAILAVPLRTQHAPLSALLVYRREPHRFNAQEINLLASFANHAAMAIENAALYAHSDMRLQEQTRRLEALIQSLHDGLVLENLQGRLIYTNRRIEEIAGIRLDESREYSIAHLTERLLYQLAQGEKEHKDKKSLANSSP